MVCSDTENLGALIPLLLLTSATVTRTDSLLLGGVRQLSVAERVSAPVPLRQIPVPIPEVTFRISLQEVRIHTPIQAQPVGTLLSQISKFGITATFGGLLRNQSVKLIHEPFGSRNYRQAVAHRPDV